MRTETTKRQERRPWLTRAITAEEAAKLPKRDYEADLRSPYVGSRDAIWRANGTAEEGAA
jgi:hypothetical protein